MIISLDNAIGFRPAKNDRGDKSKSTATHDRRRAPLGVCFDESIPYSRFGFVWTSLIYDVATPNRQV